jgi:hypothetical protein
MEACAAIQAHLGKTRRGQSAGPHAPKASPLHTPRCCAIDASVRSRRREASPGRRDLLGPGLGALRDRWKKDQPSEQTRLTALSMKGWHQQGNGSQLCGRPPGRVSRRGVKGTPASKARTMWAARDCSIQLMDIPSPQWITRRATGTLRADRRTWNRSWQAGEGLMSAGRVGPAEVRRLGPVYRKRAPFSASCCPVRASEVRCRPASGAPEDCVPLEDVAATPPTREAGC